MNFDHPGELTRLGLAAFWLVTLFAALTSCVGRTAWQLYGLEQTPPEDPRQLAAWQRKRKWLIVSEFAALPMFATLAVLLAVQGWVSPVTSVIFAMIAGALGFGFFLNALQAIVTSWIQRNANV